MKQHKTSQALSPGQIVGSKLGEAQRGEVYPTHIKKDRIVAGHLTVHIALPRLPQL